MTSTAAPATRAGRTFDDIPAEALAALRRGDPASALVLLRDVLTACPQHVQAQKLIGAILRERGDLSGACAALERVVALDPGDAEAHLYLGDIKRRLGDAVGALIHCDSAVATGQRPVEVRMTRALTRADLGDFEGAAADALDAARHAETPAILFALGHFLMKAGRPREALRHFRRAAELAPNDARLHNAAGDAAAALGDVRAAGFSYAAAVARDPTLVPAQVNLCGALVHAGQADDAVRAGETAVRLAPQDPIAWFNLAVAYDLARRPDDAIRACETAVARRPDYGEALFFLCGLKRQTCEWTGLAEVEARARDLTYRAGKAVPAFAELFATASRADLRLCNEVYAAQFADRPAIGGKRRPAGAKIRLGYLSADYRNHATATLIAELIELHDRTVFELFGYSIGDTDELPLTRRLVGAFDAFRDLTTLDDHEAARRIHDDGIDILLDLKGYTFQARPGILAHRPAPLQVNYLGYPATMGAPFIDYMIVDSIVAPAAHQPDYVEQLVQLPHSYQPNDRSRPNPSMRPTRASQGLPDDAFVFCCLNGNNKLNPAMFDIWMRLLAATPGSVLWLLATSQRAAQNLRHEAEARGIDAGRLVFAPRIPFADHLARLATADLFLDTLPCGGHTTASEALWAGLPVLTCLGETFAGRVAASLLHALDLPDLVAPDLVTYENLALSLATSPDRLETLRRRLVAARATAPLFDTTAYARAFEKALIRMRAHEAAGEAPLGFAVT